MSTMLKRLFNIFLIVLMLLLSAAAIYTFTLPNSPANLFEVQVDLDFPHFQTSTSATTSSISRQSVSSDDTSLVIESTQESIDELTSALYAKDDQTLLGALNGLHKLIQANVNDIPYLRRIEELREHTNPEIAVLATELSLELQKQNVLVDDSRLLNSINEYEANADLSFPDQSVGIAVPVDFNRENDSRSAMNVDSIDQNAAEFDDSSFAATQ